VFWNIANYLYICRWYKVDPLYLYPSALRIVFFFKRTSTSWSYGIDPCIPKCTFMSFSRFHRYSINFNYLFYIWGPPWSCWWVRKLFGYNVYSRLWSVHLSSYRLIFHHMIIIQNLATWFADRRVQINPYFFPNSLMVESTHLSY